MGTGNICQEFWYRNPSGKRRHFASSHQRFSPDPFRIEPCDNCGSLKECLNSEIKRNFDSNQMRKVGTTVRNTLPSNETIQAERGLLRVERAKSAWRKKVAESQDSEKEMKKLMNGSNTSRKSSAASTSNPD